MSKNKKTLQLGMNPSTASGRLVKDILFKFVQEAGHTCHQCGEELTRDTFSVEHKEPWLDTEDPVYNFFDLDNIAFSHLSCNAKAARKTTKKYNTDEERLAAKNKAQRDKWQQLPKEEQQEIRRAKYLKHGK